MDEPQTIHIPEQRSSNEGRRLTDTLLKRDIDRLRELVMVIYALVPPERKHASEFYEEARMIIDRLERREG